MRGSDKAIGPALLAALLLAGCEPRPVESFGPAPSESGNPAYWVEGYTRPGQLTRDFGEGYAESFARQVCRGDYQVLRVDTSRARNAFDEFLHWQALVECLDEAPAPPPAEEPPPIVPAEPLPLQPDGVTDDPLPLDPGGPPSDPLPLQPVG